MTLPARLLFCIPLLLFCGSATAQTNFPSSRVTDWSAAGLWDSVPDYGNVINILDVGGVNDSSASNHIALQNAIDSLQGSPGTIYFPPGIYYFNAPVSLPDSIVLRGAGASLTRIYADLGGSGANFITISGSISGPSLPILSAVTRGGHELTVADSTITPGNWYLITFNDSSLMFSSWAYGSGGQVVYADSRTGPVLHLLQPLRCTVPQSLHPRLTRLDMVSGSGVECLYLQRVDATASQTSNINLQYAHNCWMIGVESEQTNFGHFAASYCAHLLVRGNFIHLAHAYGGGGQGYGVVLQYATGDCLVENNIMEHLRHSFLLQAGANGNVIAYNYSHDPYWDQFPNDAAGDLLGHGNYPYLNLFEGNIGQQLFMDNSHGMNGPFHTFFRNRLELYGMIINSTPPTDSCNVANNEITNSGPFLGNYSLSGSGHLEQGNIRVGSIVPAATSGLTAASAYLTAPPGYWNNALPWPSIGDMSMYNTYTNPAFLRYQQAEMTDCERNPVFVSTAGLQPETDHSCVIYPNPAEDIVYIKLPSGEQPVLLELLDMQGRLMQQVVIPGGVTACSISLVSLPAGMYMLRAGEKIVRLIHVQ